MRILILGGTGFIGPCVVEELITLGHELALFNRGNKLLNHNIQTIKGDKNDLFSYRDEFIAFNPDVVLHMNAYTKQDAEIAMGIFGDISDRVVVISSMDVYSAYGILLGLENNEIKATPLSEESSLRSKLYPFGGEYEKILVEDIVMNHSTKISGTILRLPMVYGPGDNSHRLFKYAKRIQDERLHIVLDELFAGWKASRGYVENIAHAIVLATTKDKARGEVYNVSEASHFTELEWVSKIAEVMNWNVAIIPIPRDNLPEKLIYSSLNLAQDWTIESNKIRTELGYREPVSSRQAIERTIEWETSNAPNDLQSEDYPGFYYESEDEVLSKLGMM